MAAVYNYYTFLACITGQQCTARGQVFLPQALPPECQRTCTNPTRVCSNTTIRGPGCTCPQGTVLDEIQNRCVQLSQCSKLRNIVTIYQH